MILAVGSYLFYLAKRPMYPSCKNPLMRKRKLWTKMVMKQDYFMEVKEQQLSLMP